MSFVSIGADWDKGPGEIIPGAYYHCITDTQHDEETNELQAKAFCYIDSTTAGLGVVNPEGYPGVTGDGIAGAGPPVSSNKLGEPEVFGDVNDKHDTLTGLYDPGDGHLHLEGCWEDTDGFAAQGNTYFDATINAATGQGSVQLTILISTVADCLDGPPFADGAAFPIAKIEYVEQANKQGNGADYDTDMDGCPDAMELQDTMLGDPYNRWDFFDPSQNGIIGFTDALVVVPRFGSTDFNNTAPINRHTDPLTEPPPAPAYHPRFDRGRPMDGSNVFSLTPPDGEITAVELFILRAQTGSSCTGPVAMRSFKSDDWDWDDLLNAVETNTGVFISLSDTGTDPLNDDTDGDGMPDGYEAANACLNPVVDDGAADPDGDGLSNLDEFGLGTDPCAVDTDQDGCSDGEEVAPKSEAVLGGGRNPLYFWDFFDPSRNKAVGFTDFLALVERRHAVGDPDIDPLSDPPPPPAYHTRFDRGGQIPEGNLWEEQPPNGSIGFADFLSLVRQNHATCSAPP